jgi:hypothetical protein
MTRTLAIQDVRGLERLATSNQREVESQPRRTRTWT